MRKDPTQFRERFKAWKAGEKVYENGLPKYDNGKGVIYREDNIPFIPEKQVKLTNAGLATGAILSTNVLDSIADAAIRQGLDINTAIGLATKESTLGNPTDDRSVYTLLNPTKAAIFKKLGTGQHINKYEDNVNSRLLVNYYKDLAEAGVGDDESHNATTNESVLDAAFRLYKNTPWKYNPGQKNYLQLVDKRAAEVSRSPEVILWRRTYDAKKEYLNSRWNRLNPLLNKSKFNLPKFAMGTEGDELKNQEITNTKSPYKYIQAGIDNAWTRITNDKMGQVFQDIIVRPVHRGGNTTVGNWNRQWQPKGEPGLKIVSPEFDIINGIRGIVNMLPSTKLKPSASINLEKNFTNSAVTNVQRDIPYNELVEFRNSTLERMADARGITDPIQRELFIKKGMLKIGNKYTSTNNLYNKMASGETVPSTGEIRIRPGEESFATGHEMRHRLDYTDIWDGDKDFVLTKGEYGSLRKAFGNEFLDYGDSPTMLREMVTTNSDMRRMLLGKHNMRTMSIIEQNAKIDLATGTQLLEALKNSNDYGREYYKALVTNNLYLANLAEQLKNILRAMKHSMKYVGAVAVPTTILTNTQNELRNK